jgi:hypothetical protein
MCCVGLGDGVGLGVDVTTGVGDGLALGDGLGVTVITGVAVGLGVGVSPLDRIEPPKATPAVFCA